jgi:exopolysaccharide biosynthesis polyprenyl glycosylphosphotransferase
VTAAAGELTFAAAATPRPTPMLVRRLRARSRRRALVTASDALAVTASSAGVALATGFAMPATTDAALLPVLVVTGITVWLIVLAVLRTRASGISARREYGRVAQAAALVFALGAGWFAVIPSTTVRAQVLLGIPAGFIVLLLNRWYWRQGAPRHRRPSPARTVLVGSPDDLDALVRTIQRDGRLGYHVVGTTLVGASASESTVGPGVVTSTGIPVLGPAAATAEVARAVAAETVIVTGAPDDPDFIRRLSWQLEGTSTNLVVATRLTDVAASRMSLHTAPGLALVDVRIPTYEGAPHRVKRVLDVAAAVCALVPIALATPLIAALIRLDSPGPVFFRQRRIGRDGREFQILKFRTMRTGAELELAALASKNEGAGALFKVKRDPRITRVGAVLRKYSIDELPQFWNVLRGDMSVVGPRPPLPQEVQAYDDPVFRRLYIRPGITGPWQIGGRSDLSWEESVRLDLNYVENWSVTSDLAIMLRTAAVVVRAKGAY